MRILLAFVFATSSVMSAVPLVFAVAGDAAMTPDSAAAAPTWTRYEQASSKFGYAGAWTNQSGGSYSGGSQVYASAASAVATFTFTGTDAKFIATTGSSYGIAAISLDGGTATNVDLYASSTGLISRRCARSPDWRRTRDDPSTGKSTAYEYAAAYNLTRVSVDGSTTQSFASDAADRISSPGFAYDGNGNMTSDGTHTYAYDALNRLSAVKTAGGATIATYGYDFLNRRITTTDASGTTCFHYDGASPDVIAETDGAGNTIANYARDAAGRLGR